MRIKTFVIIIILAINFTDAVKAQKHLFDHPEFQTLASSLVEFPEGITQECTLDKPDFQPYAQYQGLYLEGMKDLIKLSDPKVKTKDFSKIQEKAWQAAKLIPFFPDAYSLLYTTYASGKTKEEKMQIVSSLQPKDGDTQIDRLTKIRLIFEFYYADTETRELGSALDLIGTAIILNPCGKMYGNFYLDRAHVYEALGQQEEASQDYETAFQYGFYENKVYQGVQNWMEILRENYDEAYRSVNSGIFSTGYVKLNTDLVYAVRSLAYEASQRMHNYERDYMTLLIRMKKFDEAFSVSGRMYSHEFNSAFEFGLIYEAKGDLPEAEKQYQAALKTKNEYFTDYYYFHEKGDILHHLGLVYLKLNNLDKAVKFFRDAVKKDKKNAMYRKKLAIALNLKGKTKDAEKECKEVMKLDKEVKSLVECLAHEESKLTESTEALETEKKATDVQTKEVKPSEGTSVVPNGNVTTNKTAEVETMPKENVQEETKPKEEVLKESQPETSVKAEEVALTETKPAPEDIKESPAEIKEQKSEPQPAVIPLKIMGVTPKKIFLSKEAEIDVKEGDVVKVVRGGKAVATLKISKVSDKNVEAEVVEVTQGESIDFDDEIVK